jgi:hypothetical protein
VPVTDLANHYAQAFDTILFAPPKSYFSRCKFEDGNNIGGVGAMARDAFDTLLRPGGKVVQIGHTATNMPGKKGYEREAIHLFAPIEEGSRKEAGETRWTPPLTFISVDKKPADNRPPPPQKGKSVPCLHCGQVFPAEPTTTDIVCSTCGSAPGTACLSNSGAPMVQGHTSIFHDSRWKALREIADEIRHGECPNSPTGTHLIKPTSGIYLPSFNTECINRAGDTTANIYSSETASP